MVATRRRQEATAAVPEQPSSDSDDEAPEEVTLAVGKQSAEQRRREEAEAKAAARAAAKERRSAAAGRRAAAAAEQQAAEGLAEEEENADAVGSEEEEEEEAEEEAEEEEGLDLLPDDVLAALASNKRTQPTAEQKRLISEQLRRQREPGQPLAVLGSQRQQISELEAGPVVVRVLRPEEPSQASQSARDFLQQRLGGVKRSADMLKPVRALQPAHIAQRQVQHMAALQAQRRQSKQAAAVAAGGAPQAKRRR